MVPSLLSSCSQLPEGCLFGQLINDLHLRLIQTPCLDKSGSTQLSKTLVIDHYLRIDYFNKVIFPNHGEGLRLLYNSANSSTHTMP